MKLSEILAENQTRASYYYRDYSRIEGDPLCEVIPRRQAWIEGRLFWLPETMFNLSITKELAQGKTFKEIVSSTIGYTVENEKEVVNGFIQARFAHDFEFWAYSCVWIQSKEGHKIIKFALNKGQRELLKSYEDQRLAGKPIRVVLVKARQWGGSTLTQIYMLWLQLFHYENWHSIIVANVKNQAVTMRRMMSGVLRRYPKEQGKYDFKAITDSQNMRYIPQRGCEIQIGSSQSPETLRSSDLSMAHLSEVSTWVSTATKSGDDLAQSLGAAILDEPGTFICYESTAKGIGNFFHQQYLDAISEKSAFKAVFVPWYKIDIYRLPIKDYKSFIDSLTPYNWWQYKQGATLEGINWYNTAKRIKNYNDFKMKSEYPTTAEEAFQSKSGRFFDEEMTSKARETCEDPIFVGDIRGNATSGPECLDKLQLISRSSGGSETLSIWTPPHTDGERKILNRFLVVVDIGGKVYTSDNSVISVFDRAGLMDAFGALERAAMWVGHIDHDLLAWKAAQIAKYYDNALLAIESNTIDSRDKKSMDVMTYEGDHFYTVINEISEHYHRLYARNAPPDKVVDNGEPIKYGWHMNKKTKYQAYDRYYAALREDQYIEKSGEAVNEMEWLAVDPNGKINAIPGKKDDIQDTTAIGNYIAFEEMPIPKYAKDKEDIKSILGNNVGIATI